MARYIGTKVVEAEPLAKDGQEGYEVIYSDGYASWTPKDVFEASYNLVSHMNFGDAMYYMKAGAAVRLPIWGEGVMIRAQFPDTHSKMTHPYLYIESPHGMVPWSPTHIELLREDWELVWGDDNGE